MMSSRGPSIGRAAIWTRPGSAQSACASTKSIPCVAWLAADFAGSNLSTPAFPGAVVADQSLNGVTEWALGVSRWFEAGLYLPLYSYDKNNGFGLDGFRLRALVAVPDVDDRRFFYGANFEFSVNARRWDQQRFTSEVRPIVGWHLEPWDIIFNPIVDTAYDGIGHLELVPATRVAYNFRSRWTPAAEEYDDFGSLHAFAPRGEQVHQLFAVVDRAWKGWDVEAGVGAGFTGASDRLTCKLILARDLHHAVPVVGLRHATGADRGCGSDDDS